MWASNLSTQRDLTEIGSYNTLQQNELNDGHTRTVSLMIGAKFAGSQMVVCVVLAYNLESG